MAKWLDRLMLLERLRGSGRAFFQSLAAVVLLAIGGGVVFLPAELKRLQAPDANAIATYVAGDAGRLGVMLVHTLSRDHTRGSRHRLIVQDFACDKLVEVAPPLPGRPLCLAICVNTSRLFIGDDNGTISFLDLRHHQAGLLGRHITGIPHQLNCSADGRTLISLGERSIYAWDLDRWQLRWWRSDLGVSCAQILSDSRTVVCQEVGKSGTHVLELDVETGKTLQIVGATESLLHDLTISPDGMSLAGIGRGGTIVLWQRSASEAPWQAGPMPSLYGGTRCVTASFSHDSSLLVVGDVDNRRVAVWDLKHGRRVCQLGNGDNVALGAKFIDADNLLTWNADGTTELWRWREGSLVRSDSIPPVSQSS